MRIVCPKCGIDQDETTPRCVHMAGKRGGQRVREKYGSDHYAKIGQQGGMSNVKKRGVGFLQEIGKKGAAAVKKKYGKEFYTQMGKKAAEKRSKIRDAARG